MVIETASVLTGIKLVLVVTVGVCVAAGILAWRERPEPGAVPLTFLMAGACWWAATLFFRLEATGLEEKVFWVDVSWIGIVIIPVAWVLFALEYTGQSQYINRRVILLLSIIPAISAVLGVTDPYHSLFYTDSALVEYNGVMILERTPGIWFWVIAAYTLVLGLLGAIPLMNFVTSDVETFRGQSLAILVGSLTPIATNLLFLLGALPFEGIDLTPVSFGVSGVAFLGALTRFRLFTTSPAPIQPARNAVFDRMQEGAIILDRHNNIIDMNAGAAQALDIAPEEVLGESLRRGLPRLNSLIETRAESSRMTIDVDNRTYDVSLNDITDTHGRLTGRVITMHDISAHVKQQQRLEVLNRVFRHNVRTNTQVIMGNAEYLATNNSEQKAQKVQEKAREIEKLSSDIRTVLDVFERGRKQSKPVRLHMVIRECNRIVEAEYPNVRIEYDNPYKDHYVDRILDDILFNLIENAARHNTNSEPTVWIEVSPNDDRVQITVRDNGPGIDDQELSLMTNKTETPLEHGSGFGLAIALWGVEAVDGEISFEEHDPTGLAVTVEVPILSRSDPQPRSAETSQSNPESILTDWLSNPSNSAGSD